MLIFSPTPLFLFPTQYKFDQFAMSHEFEIHHHLSQLISLLHIQDAGEVKDYVDLLLKNRTPYITTQVNT